MQGGGGGRVGICEARPDAGRRPSSMRKLGEMEAEEDQDAGPFVLLSHHGRLHVKVRDGGLIGRQTHHPEPVVRVCIGAGAPRGLWARTNVSVAP